METETDEPSEEHVRFACAGAPQPTPMPATSVSVPATFIINVMVSTILFPELRKMYPCETLLRFHPFCSQNLDS